MSAAAHQEIAGPGLIATVGPVSVRVAGKAEESRDKGAEPRGDKTGGHCACMNIHGQGRTALCMHGNTTKGEHIVCVLYICVYTSFTRQHIEIKFCEVQAKINSTHPSPSKMF